MIHRDVKAENILIDIYGEPILIDFGLAVEKQSKNTFFTSAIGDPEIQSPEMWEKRIQYNEGTDIWGLGITLYRKITRKENPFDAENYYPQKLKLFNSNNPFNWTGEIINYSSSRINVFKMLKDDILVSKDKRKTASDLLRIYFKEDDVKIITFAYKEIYSSLN